MKQHFRMAQLASLLAFGLFGAALTSGCAGQGSDDATTVRGQLVNIDTNSWTFGPGYMIAFSLAVQSGSPVPLVSGPVDDTGNFMLSLPGSATVTKSLKQLSAANFAPNGSGCTSTVTLDPATVGSATVVVDLYQGNNRYAPQLADKDGSTFQNSTRITYYTYEYFDHDFNIVGDASCATPPKVSHNEHYKLGWNVSIETVNGTDISYANGTVPETTKWLVVP